MGELCGIPKKPERNLMLILFEVRHRVHSSNCLWRWEGSSIAEMRRHFHRVVHAHAHTHTPTTAVDCTLHNEATTTQLNITVIHMANPSSAQICGG